MKSAQPVDPSRDAAEGPELREWFQDLRVQEHASRFGMWLFLTSEVLLFGALIALYVAYRIDYSAEFAAAAAHNDVVIGTVNTFVLITSSFAVAWSIHSLRGGGRRMCAAMLALAVVLGGVFLALKGLEYAHHFEQGIYPGHYYASEELAGRGPLLFFTLYYMMTFLHALHVTGGMIVLSVLCVMVLRGRMRPGYHAALENGGLYWHLVDVIWIFLWPLLYLMR